MGTASKAYRIEISPRAERQFGKLPAIIRARLRPHIDALADNPRPPGAKKMKGEKDGYRLRIGDYRVLYEIRDDRLIVLVVKVGHRREIYDRS